MTKRMMDLRNPILYSNHGAQGQWPPADPTETPTAPRGTPTVSDPSDLVTPRSRSEFYQMMTAATRHHQQRSIACEAIAAELRKTLPLAKNKNGFLADSLRVDLKVQARMVARHLINAAAAETAAEKAHRAAYVTFLNFFTEQAAPATRNAFDLEG